MNGQAMNPQTTRAALEQQHKGGAGWFFWIAGLSLVNTAVFLSGSQVNFIVGLGITQIFDGIGHELSKNIGILGKLLAILFDIIAAGVFVLFGYFSRKQHGWAFLTGMMLYALDGLIFLIFKDFLSFGFHIFALFCIFNGYRASIALGKIDANPAPEGNLPQL